MLKWKHYYAQVKDRVKFDRGFLRGAVTVARLWLYFTSRRIGRRVSRNPYKAALAFHPQPAGPWYTIWLALQSTDIKIKSAPDNADYIFIFDDSTHSENIQPPPGHKDTLLLNDRVTDISKVHVSDVFETVFGYPIRIDPVTYDGKIVEKSDINGVHDGRIIDGPIDPADIREGYVYQKLIDSTFSSDSCEDLRIACVFGDVAAVFHKHKALDKRFGTDYMDTIVRQAADVFSHAELSNIKRFCKTIGLDFGAVDVIRDKHNGEIYIVDVNKTCMPVLSLPWPEQIRSLELIGSAFQRAIFAKSA